MKRWNVALFLGAMAFAMAQCGGDSGGSTGATPDPDVGKAAVTKSITAAEGGSISTPSGNATLTISKNALPGDTEISVAVEASTADTAASVYNFGPDGLQFQVPVELEIKFDGTVGDNQKAALATYDDAQAKWVEVEDSSLKDGVVKGKIKHFSKFSIVLIDNQAIITSSCADVAASFSACGGDVVGTWKFKDVCTNTESITTGFQTACPGVEITFEFTMDITVTFNGDGTYTSQSGEQTRTLSVPMSCLNTLQEQCDEQMSMPCTVDGADCVCTETETGDGPGDGTWEVTGTSLAMTKNGDTSDGAQPFCVSDGKVVVQIAQQTGDGQTIYMYYVLEKQ